MPIDVQFLKIHGLVISYSYTYGSLCVLNLISCSSTFIYFFSLFWTQTLTSTGTKKGDLFLADVNTQLKNKNVTTDIKVDTASNVCSMHLYS